jgi:hypothetical protein
MLWHEGTINCAEGDKIIRHYSINQTVLGGLILDHGMFMGIIAATDLLGHKKKPLQSKSNGRVGW